MQWHKWKKNTHTQIKSYESISSLSSDGLKAAAAGNTSNNNNTSGNNSAHSVLDANSSAGTIDAEPFYDTVPIEETDDDIDVESGNEMERRDLSSSLPKALERKINMDGCGQAGERVSNYININYFLG